MDSNVFSCRCFCTLVVVVVIVSYQVRPPKFSCVFTLFVAWKHDVSAAVLLVGSKRDNHGSRVHMQRREARSKNPTTMGTGRKERSYRAVSK